MTERRRRPRALAVASGSLATFLAVLTLLGAQMRSGHDPALGTAQVSSSTHGKSVVTRTSGGTTTSATSQGGHHAAAPVVTRTSGGGGEGEDD